MKIEFSELFKGIAVIIDDELNTTGANVEKILEQISVLKIPIVKYLDIPSDEDVSHFQNLSFIILDWRLDQKVLSTAERQEGLTVPGTLEEDDTKKNIAFIKLLQKQCYCPIFIITNEEPSVVIDKLESNGISASSTSNIFVKSKNFLTEKGSLESAVMGWIEKNPSIYVLKEWEREYQKSKTKMFLEFQNMSAIWPNVMWKCINDDEGNESLELGELISLNLHTRMAPFEFNEEILKSPVTEICHDEIRKVLEGSRYLQENNLHKENISTGDLFREEYTEGTVQKSRYFLNIRAQCDTIRSSSLDDTQIYCLKGFIIDETNIFQKVKDMPEGIKGYILEEGQFHEKINNAIIPFIDDGKVIEFKFRDLVVKKWKELKDKRVGRILPPYITRIQQRYALYLHRQGLPRIPDEALVKPSSKTKTE